MASKAAYKRLTKEYMAIQKSPIPYITTKPLEENILEWHYVLTGPPDTPYQGGQYHGKVIFPSEYPFKPPSIRMITPSGRFKPNARICMSMSEFHPNTWNPAWSVSTILNGLLSFMVGEEETTGSVRTTDAMKKALALKSQGFNYNNSKFREIFPELCVVPAPNIQNQTQNPLNTQNGVNGAEHNDTNRNANGNRNWLGIGDSWSKLMVFLFVCIYLLVSKIVARSY
ncbi:UBC-like protein [Basidiobolus meristosporus CBS 931.73]|uniref:Ubiquitin-conjugating enzyme E2 6 n=1 Tax=Basidiobolus meristosporus CBS 931.73 TaxID=1314790 RepID=A0A1Y1Y5U5_9FUNG|nr:UBC-like protein [Basidiobolus meristosporus CBS 931.73]|eukprot:ORX93382.1 UBC-like protein [Basidiobolus meristosporus CBS 931.73]